MSIPPRSMSTRLRYMSIRYRYMPVRYRYMSSGARYLSTLARRDRFRMFRWPLREATSVSRELTAMKINVHHRNSWSTKDSRYRFPQLLKELTSGVASELLSSLPRRRGSPSSPGTDTHRLQPIPDRLEATRNRVQRIGNRVDGMRNPHDGIRNPPRRDAVLGGADIESARAGRGRDGVLEVLGSIRPSVKETTSVEK
jgi:hypothetical protein